MTPASERTASDTRLMIPTGMDQSAVQLSSEIPQDDVAGNQVLMSALSQIIRLRLEVAELMEVCMKLHKEKKALSLQIEDTIHNANRFQDEHRQNIDELNRLNAELQAKLDQNQALIKEKIEQVESLKEQLQTVQGRNGELDTRVKELSHHFAAIQEERSGLAQANGTLRQQISDLNAQIHTTDLSVHLSRCYTVVKSKPYLTLGLGVIFSIGSLLFRKAIQANSISVPSGDLAKKMEFILGRYLTSKEFAIAQNFLGRWPFKGSEG